MKPFKGLITQFFKKPEFFKAMSSKPKTGAQAPVFYS
jgi:hypothetical protein